MNQNVQKNVDLEIEQLAHFSPEEIAAIDQLIGHCVANQAAPDEEKLKLLRKDIKACDIACFGRMLADSPDFNIDAAVQVAHAVTTHGVDMENDFFTAVDDLNNGKEDSGAGHLGGTEFAAGLFYGYICIDRDFIEEKFRR